MPKSKYYHPPHIFQDNTIYFVSVKTIEGKHYFDTDSKKSIAKKVLLKALSKFNISLYAWVILNNHYHLLFHLQKGEDLWKFIKNLNENSSRILNETENKIGRKIWYQYWDYCIRNEKDFFLHFNYIHHNLVKHNYFKTQEEVANYRFCSYGDWVNKRGKEFLFDCFEKYPIKDFTVEND